MKDKYVKNYLYLDVETTGYDKVKDKLTLIAFASCQIEDGKIKMDDALTQLKEWEHPDGEKGILKDFFSKVHLDWIWYDVPLGYNLPFDVDFIIKRAEHHGIKCPFDFQFIFDKKPHIDLRVVGALMFQGMFQGSGLGDITNKKGTGKDAVIKYNAKQYQELCEYNREEYLEFMKLFQFLLIKMPELMEGFKKW